MKAFEPLQIRNMQLKNRIVMPPMCMYSAFNQDGRVGGFHLAHYTARAIGQAALIIVEATGIRPEGRISDECLGLWEDGQTAGMASLAKAVREQSALRKGRERVITHNNSRLSWRREAAFTPW